MEGRKCSAVFKVALCLSQQSYCLSTYTYCIIGMLPLAFPGPHDSNAFFSITYRRAASKPSEGELGTGGIINVKKGTIFNVTRTNLS
jgi:hypothetical protein